MSEFLEACMVICFGISWPLAIMKSIRSRTAKGKSLLFMSFIAVGYVCGIFSKLTYVNFQLGDLKYVFWFYVLNLIMVSTDIGFYFRNRKLDRAAEHR